MYAPVPVTVTSILSASQDQVAIAEPSCGATGVPHPSSTPCHPSNQVSSPKTFSKDPSALNLYSSSKRQALVSTSSAELLHQSVLPNSGPTPNATAWGASFHVP